MAAAKKTPAPKPEAADEQQPETSNVPAVRKTGQVVSWEDQLAADAAESAQMEASTSTGQFFSTKAGQLVWDGTALPDNQMAVIIVDSVFETVYYETEFDADDPSPPTAFAFGRDEKEMRWHETSDPRFAGELCHESEVCQWGTADKGAGKAAREIRRLALIPAGKFDKTGKFVPVKKAEELETAPLGFLKIPPTSTKGFSAFVKQLAGSLKRPPHGIFAKVKIIPDTKSQFKIIFEPLLNVPNDLMPAVMAKREEAKLSIMAPYQMTRSEEPAGKKPAAKKPAAKAPARGAAKPAAKAAGGAKRRF